MPVHTEVKQCKFDEKSSRHLKTPTINDPLNDHLHKHSKANAFIMLILSNLLEN